MNKYKLIYWSVAAIIILATAFFTYKYFIGDTEKNNERVSELMERRADSTSKALDAVLKELEEQSAVEVKEAKPQISNLKKKVDEFNNVTFYKNKKYSSSYSNEIIIYICKSEKVKNTPIGGYYFMRAIFQYTSSDWLFMNRIEFLCDGKKYVVDVSKAKHDNDSGDIYEYMDLPLNKKLKETIAAIIYSKETKMRYVGNEFIHDRLVKDSEKKLMKEVYECLF